MRGKGYDNFFNIVKGFTRIQYVRIYYVVVQESFWEGMEYTVWMTLEYVTGAPSDPSSRLWETLPTRRPSEKRDSFYEEEPINMMESR